MKLRLLFACVGLLAAIPAHAVEDPHMILFRYATLIDAEGGPSVPDVDVTVQLMNGEGWITAAAPSSTSPGKPPANALVINARGKYLMPGLIDVHTHQRGGEAALAGYLYSGVTTIADCGNQPDVILPLRDAERARRIPSPRIFAAGLLITAPHGKSTEIGLEISDAVKDRALLEKHLGEHPDFIKLVYDEGGWPGTSPVTMLPTATLRGVVAFYKERGLRSFVHVVNERRAREAIDAGVDTLAHPVMEERISDAFVKLMADKKIPFATTLTIGDGYGRLINHPEYLDRPDYAAVLSSVERETLRTKTRVSYMGERAALAQWRIASMPVTKENIRRIVAAGGVAALGTDQSNGAAVHREIELLAEAGLTPAQIITAATHNAAVFLGKADELGSVEAGKRADLLLLEDDPLADIANINHISLVMKDGRIINEATLPLGGGPQQTRFTGQAEPFHR